MAAVNNDEERAPLLGANGAPEPVANVETAPPRHRATASALLLLVFIAGLVLSLWFWETGLPRNPLKAAKFILNKSPVIDGHIDLPILVRGLYSNDVDKVELDKLMPAHVDIPRLREGRVGAFFWCAAHARVRRSSCLAGACTVGCTDSGVNYTVPTNRVRDTLEQIDVSRLLIDKYPDTFAFATSAHDIRMAIFTGKIASLLGVEGAHQLGNSLGVLRAYYTLGVRYMTLTHSCSNAFADSAGIATTPAPVHGGLSALGRALIGEMNRLGMLVDLSHVSDATAAQALDLTRAPVIWSHSSARGVWDVPRNVPDSLLKRIGTRKGQVDAVVMVNFAPFFVAAEGNATVAAVADHVEHIGRVAGRKHVGLGSDFDGIGDAPAGLEDVSKYPNLFAELLRRGWNQAQLTGLAGGNLLRVLDGAERAAQVLREGGMRPSMALYDRRPDLPMRREDM